MARFDYYAHPEGAGYLVDVQSDLMDHLNTRLVVPLLAGVQAPPAQKRLNVTVELNAQRHVFLTQLMATAPLATLGLPQGSLAAHEASIERAINMVFHGF